MAIPLALVCECLTPILVLACFTLPWLHKKPATKKLISYTMIVELSLGLISTYGLMWLDNTYQIWPAFGLDYSTHTAFALTFCLPLVKHQHWSWLGMLLLYAWLMKSLNYHSWADMLTTLLAWSIATLLPLMLLFRQLEKLKFRNGQPNNLS